MFHPSSAQHKISEIQDADGRTIKVRRLTALDTLRLFKLAGPTLAQNQPWLSLATLAYAVTEIDAIPVPAPVTELQVEALIERLGDQALSLIADHLDATADETPESMAASAGN